MKQTRLLEIIREEISNALGEAGLGDQIASLQKTKDAFEKQKAPLDAKKESSEKIYRNS
jgi:predicted nuclease with TOPRIM domain